MSKSNNIDKTLDGEETPKLPEEQTETGVPAEKEGSADALSDASAYSREMFEKAEPGANVGFSPDDGLPVQIQSTVDSDLAFYSLMEEPKKQEEEPKKVRIRKKTVVTRGATVRSMALAVAYIAAVLVIGVLVGMFLIEAVNDVMAFSKDESIIKVEITDEDMSLDELADLLHDEGLIKYPFLFKLYVGIKRDGAVDLQAGTYELSPSYNYDKMVSSLHPSTPLTIVKITFPEGITTDEVIELFVSNGIGTYEGFRKAIEEEEFDYWFLEDLETTEDRYYRLDGYLYPDTYQFYSTSSEKTALNKLLSNFRKKFSEQYMERVNELGLTLDQAVIIASMIQAEASRTSDYVYVSAAFHNRLRSAEYTKFESDATVQYVLSHEYGGRHEELTAEDLLIESPYNTRISDGFPPGPICNVSLNALKAAIYPDEDCGYYYFVTGNDGYMVYAATYAEHLKNIKAIEDEKAD